MCVAFYQLEKQGTGRGTQLVDGLPDSREGWFRISSNLGIIEAYQCDVFRHSDPYLAHSAQGT